MRSARHGSHHSSPSSTSVPGALLADTTAAPGGSSSLGSDRAADLGEGGRFHEIRRIITDLAVLDLLGPAGAMRLASVHPGVDVATVVDRTGFGLYIPDDVPTTRAPTPAELDLIRTRIDPDGAARATVK